MTLKEISANGGQSHTAPSVIGVEEGSRTSWLVCRAGGIMCALPVGHVKEIMRVLPIEQIAGVPKYVLGLSIIRGAPAPVVDLGAVIGNQQSTATRLIAVRAAGRTIALAVQAVIGITAITPAACGQLPPLLRDAATDTIAAIGASDAELIVFLQTARLLPDEVLARIDIDGAE